MDTKENIVDQVINEIRNDILMGDIESLHEMLSLVYDNTYARKYLIGYLPSDD